MQVKGSVGMKSMMSTLQDALLLSVRAQLRWNKTWKDLGLYGTLLLKVNKLDAGSL